MKQILFLILIFFLSQSVIYSQDILHKAKKININAIENFAIRRTKKKLNLPKYEHLSTFSYFGINFKNKIETENCSIADLLSNMRFCFKDPVSFVFDDSLNVLAEVDKKKVMINYKPEILKEYMYIRYFYKSKPDYIFRIFNTPLNNYLFLCYKNNNFFVTYMSNDKKKIISYPLCEFDCRLLYTDANLLLTANDEELPCFPQE